MGSQYSVPQKDWKALEKLIGKAKIKKLLASPTKDKFKHFHKSWSKSNVLSIWKGETWAQVLDFCKVADITPKQVMNYVAGLKVNKTDQKTILIAKLMHTRFTTKLTTRSLAINLKKELIKIDKSLANRGDESDKHWHERIYQRVFKALQRYDL